MMTKKYDAIVFDFDGVLVESVDVKTQAFGALYAEYGDRIVEQVKAYHLLKSFGITTRFYLVKT
jgi:beta-phosphoglucomutase-like phosphatase (HAD superfamily)